jgi:bifunctional aspartokinase / homoserine dehydrogenase 1
MKFGGSSVSDADRIKRVAGIVAAEKERPVVVLSAMRGVTDGLEHCGAKAAVGDLSYRDDLATMRTRHLVAVEQLGCGGETADGVRASFDELTALLHGVELIRECSPRTRDLIMGFGELLMCDLFARYLVCSGTPATLVDARQVIVTDGNHGSAAVLPQSFARIKAAVDAVRRSGSGVAVFTGYTAATVDGVATTLGRNGSDYTASIVGKGVGASVVEIWTDVDGVLSADPRSVPQAFVIPEMTFQEAMEMAYFGASVLHPYTMLPAVEADIPIRIKNTLNPQAPGTLISTHARRHDTPVTGLASIDNVALVNVEGGGMLGIPGFAARIFAALARVHVNIIMISQASSEHSICLVFRGSESAAVEQTLNEELAREIASGRIQETRVSAGLAVVAVIGDNMRGTPGVSGRIFGRLGQAGINVLAIAQGSSERNISLVVARHDMQKTLGALHAELMEGAR